MSSIASSGHSSSGNVVVSRSTVRRKPPIRGSSGDRLAEMRRGVTDRYMIPNTPMSNRQRMAVMAAKEMATPESNIDSDDETLNSNTSLGSISLKSPGGARADRERDRDREDKNNDSNRRRRSSSTSANAARTASRRNGNRGSSNDLPSDAGQVDKERSSRSERRVDRTVSGVSTSGTSNGGGNNRHRSSSRKRNDRGTRSNSLNEKRNSRAHKLNTSKKVETDQPPKSYESTHRSNVTEDEIMELLNLDYSLMPLTTSDGRRGSGTRNENSKRSEKETTKSPRLSVTNSHSSNSRDHKRSKSPGCSSRDRSLSIERLECEQSHHRRRAAESPQRNHRAGSSHTNRANRASREEDLSNSAGSFDRKVSLSSSSSIGGKSSRRTTPRRTKSEDHGLDSFLQQGMAVSRRVKPGSGARSVASMPAKSMARRRRGSVGGLSDRTDATEDTTKPSSSSHCMAGQNEDNGPFERMGNSATIHHNDVGDEYDDDDNASIDLDLATARKSFQQQNLNEKLQLHLSKTDELLYSVFPRHVADALRNGQKVEPENHDLVTIFFSDIVGFTDISSKLDPMKISEMLDRLYHSFDALSEYHDVFKVETIGDAYMAVTNLAKQQPDHCKRISEFAIDAIRVANQTLIDVDNPGMGFVKIRVGFHSGPVVSNVVGTRNPRYCLFGDSVNTASRMESNSEENRIHCSEISATLLREQCPKIPIFPRGSIEVKGKGEMKTFWVHTEGSVATSTNTAKNGAIRKVLNTLRGERGPRTQKIAAS